MSRAKTARVMPTVMPTIRGVFDWSESPSEELDPPDSEAAFAIP